MSAKISVGVLVGTGKLRKLLQSAGGSRLETLIAASRSTEIDLFFFALDDVNLSTRCIHGIFCAEDNGWRTKIFPYPQAFYRRHTITDQERKVFSKFLSQLRTSGSVFLNYQCPMDKWEIYQCLSGNTEIEQYLPPTWFVQLPSQVFMLLESNNVLYLKDPKGGKGKQVMRVEKLRSGDYAFSRFYRSLTSGSLQQDGLDREIQEFFGNKSFIAQKAIDLIQVNRCNVDFRAEVQRDGAGRIRVVAIPVRIARVRSPITTHAASMALEKFSSLYPSLIPECNAFQNEAGQFLKQIYRAVENSYGPCGELGIDFGLDKSGKLWFFEANAQSAKVSLFNSYPELVTRSFIELLNYAKYRVEKVLPPLCSCI